MDRDKKWNLQDIKPAEPRKRRPVRKATPRINEVPTETASRPSRRVRQEGVKKRKTIWVIVAGLLLILIASFVISSLFGGAKVTVYPRFRDPVINTALEAKKDAGNGELAYEVLTLEAEGERQVTATGQENVTELATGKITIYNTTSDSQRLVKNTRFATTDGKVFHISESAEVPGAEGGEPGSVVADVFADEAGPDYNISAGTELSVPGFKESDLMDLYNAITGKVTGDITGGYDGPRYIIDDTELTAAKESLHTELREALKQRLSTEKPAGFLVFDEAVTFTYNSLQSEAMSDSGSEVKIKEKAVLTVPIFSEGAFAGHIASVVVPGYEGEDVRIQDTSALEFSLITNASSTEVNLDNSVSFKLVGKPRLVWEYNVAQLKEDLSGALLVSLNTILGGYPAIEKATTSIQPFWHRSFPEDTKNIEIIEIIGSDEE